MEGWCGLELGWTASKQQIYTDNVHISLWQADKSEMQGTSKDQGMVLSFSRLYGRWLPFARGGISEDAGALTEKSFSTGFGYYGLGGKSSNFGAAVNYAEISDTENQYTIEVFYLLKPVSYLEITPDIQYVINPALNPDEDSIVIAGLRARIIW